MMDNIVWLAVACLVIIVFVRFKHTRNKTKGQLDKEANIQDELQRLRAKRDE